MHSLYSNKITDLTFFNNEESRTFFANKCFVWMPITDCDGMTALWKNNWQTSNFHQVFIKVYQNEQFL